MCTFAGEYILSSGSQNGSGSSIGEDSPLLNEASLGLDNHPLTGLADDSLVLNDTLGLEHDFTSELLGGSLLESAGVEGLLSNDTLGLPDEFNLEEALQLVGLDEAPPEVCEVFTACERLYFESLREIRIMRCSSFSSRSPSWRSRNSIRISVSPMPTRDFRDVINNVIGQNYLSLPNV